jgi:hypothetical protein
LLFTVNFFEHKALGWVYIKRLVPVHADRADRQTTLVTLARPLELDALINFRQLIYFVAVISSAPL